MVTLTANEPAIEVPPDEELGEAMLNLTRSQRAFVVALLEGGGNATRAAGLAGYGGTDNSRRVAAFRMMRKPSVMAAIREEADRRLRSGAILASSKLIELIDNGDPKIAFKASVEVLNRAGLLVTTQHKVVIEDNRDTDTLRNEIASRLLTAMKQKSLPMLEKAIEGEFTPVDDNDISDLMGEA